MTNPNPVVGFIMVASEVDVTMEYKWWALSATSVGALMASIDSTIVLLALLPMAEDLHSDFIVMIWVVVAYLLINTAFVLSLGRIGDMYGRKRMYNTGFAVFPPQKPNITVGEGPTM